MRSAGSFLIDRVALKKRTEEYMNFETIDIDGGKQLIDETEVNIVDIRDSAAYAAAHIENALHLNDGNVQAFLESADKSQTLLVYCYHGHSSRGAAEYFANLGFSQVYSMDGGFESWRTKYPVEISE